MAALAARGDTLGVAPTCAGKTIMLSFGHQRDDRGETDAKACVLAHRDELTAQNRTNRQVNGGIRTSVVDATDKSWAGQVTFAMVPTLARAPNLAEMPRLICSPSTRRIALWPTATAASSIVPATPIPTRFSSASPPRRTGATAAVCARFSTTSPDQVRLGELIASGHLVPPRTFVIDVGVQEQLREVGETAADFDMDEVDEIMNHAPITAEVIRHWREKASDRLTVVFCSTVDHARNVAEAFVEAGIPAAFVHGEMSAGDRAAALATPPGGCKWSSMSADALREKVESFMSSSEVCDTRVTRAVIV